MNEPLVQTQVIPYLRELVKGGHDLTLLTFEPGDVDESEIRSTLAADGIEWNWLRYHKRPSVPATLFDIANAVRFIRKLMKRRPFEILHARSHVPMMMAALARKASSNKPKLLFDIRGFMPEEYVDAGVWSESGAIYRNVKTAESWLMAEADGFVILTEAARDVLFPESAESGYDNAGRPVEVIPCCVDFERRFSGDASERRAMKRKQLQVEDRFVIAHVGALGGLYLTEEIADLLYLSKLENEKTFALFLTQSNPELIIPLLRDRGFSETDFIVRKVPASEVEDYVYASDVGLSFVKATFATKSRSPTKIPEYLAAGLPIIANAGVGDTNRQLDEDGCGTLLHELTERGYRKAIRELSSLRPNIAELCRKSARMRFDLAEVGGRRYRRLYDSLTDRPTID